MKKSEEGLNRQPQIITLLAILAISLAACGGNAAAEAVTLADIPTSEVIVQNEIIEEPVVESEVGEAVAESAGEVPESGEEASADKERVVPSLVLGDPMLHASDPSSVKLASGKYQLVEFFAYWCGTCKAIAPAVHGLEIVYGDDVNFVYLDRDDPATSQFREALGYVYQPHIFLLNPDGIVLGQWTGYVNGSVLQDAIENYVY